METYDKNGLTAKTISILTGVTPSTISRFISENAIKPAQEFTKRNFRFSVVDTRKILKEFMSNRHKIDYQKKVHAFYNFKGGTGKTSLCFQVSTHLALCGYKVLLIDSDPQGHLTVSFGFHDNLKLPTLYDLIVYNRSIDDVKIPIFEGLDLIPGNLSLTNIEVRLNEMVKKEEVLKRVLKDAYSDYDFIIFDCNPSISNLNRNILSCCNVIEIVCETHPYSINGMKLLMEDLVRFYETMDLKIPQIIVVPNKYEDRAGSSAEAMTVLNKYYSEYLMPNFAVRRSEDFPKSARDQMPLSFFCKTNSNALQDTKDLVDYIIKISGQKEAKLDFAS